MVQVNIGIICIERIYFHGTQLIQSLNYFVEILLLGRLELINCSFKSFHRSRWQYQPVERLFVRITESLYCNRRQYQLDENFCYKPPWLFIITWFRFWSRRLFRHKPPWLFINQITYINKTSCAPSAGQLRILLLLLLLQMAHSLDVHTCSLLDAVSTCLLVIMGWRPHIVLIPVAVVVVLLLFWWPAHCAYRALSDTLVRVVTHLIILSLWGAGLLVFCVKEFGLDSFTFLDWFTEVTSQATSHNSDSSNEATFRGISCNRTLSTDSLDSLGTLDTVATTNEIPESLDSLVTSDTATTTSAPTSILTQHPFFSFGSRGATGDTGTRGKDFSLVSVPTNGVTIGSLSPIPKFNFGFREARGNAGTGSEFMVPPAGYFRFGSSLSSPHCSDGLLSAFPELYSLEEKLAFSSSMHSLPTTDGIHCNSDAPSSSFAYVTDSVVPDIPSLRRKVRVKGSSKPTITSETHSEMLTDEASLESPAFAHTQESVLAMQSPLESSLSAREAFLLKWDGVPIYSWWSHECSCMERLTLSVWELEEYIEACESHRGVRYTQYCQFDRDPPSFEQFDQMCKTAD